MAFKLENYPKLKEAILKNNLVIFAGAGTSANLKNKKEEELGTWTNLVKQILLNSEKTIPKMQQYINLLEDHEPIDILRLIENNKDIEKSDIYSFTKDFYDLNSSNNLKLHQKIANLCNIVITTNYDTAFEEASPNLKKNVAYTTRNYELTTSRNKEPLLIKLHGCISDAGSMVLFPANYEALYSADTNDAKHTLTVLKNLIYNNTILFLGCGMGDFQISRIFKEVRDIQDDFSSPHYIISRNKIDSTINFLTHIPINDHKEIGPILDVLINYKYKTGNEETKNEFEKLLINSNCNSEVLNLDLTSNVEVLINFAEMESLYVNKLNIDEFRLSSNMLMEYLTRLSNEKLMDSETLKGNYIDDTLFNAIITNTDGSADESFIRDILLQDHDKLKYWKRSVIVSALTLSLTQKLDIRKLKLLIEFIHANEDFVWQKALVGLVTVLQGREHFIKNEEAFLLQLKDLQNHPKVQLGLIAIAEAFDELENKKHKIEEWSNACKFKNQMEYFEKPVHWFLPFYENNPVLKESAIEEPMKTLLCESLSWTTDIFKYAYCKNYHEFNDYQNTKLVNILIKENNDLKRISINNMPYMKAFAIDMIFNTTVYELYYFYVSFSKTKFQNLFTEKINIHDRKIFELISTSKTKSNILSKRLYNMGLNFYNNKETNEAILYFKKSIEINPYYSEAWNDLGNAILELGKIKNDENLFKQSFEKYDKATKINNQNDSAFNNWGIAIHDLAKIKNDENLFEKSFEKYDKATKINDQNDSTFYNWGNVILELAIIKNDEIFFKQSFDKYDKATKINNQNDSAFNNWGIAIHELAKIKNDEDLFKQSFEKYDKATKINNQNDSTFNNWGIALYDLAKIKNDEELFEDSFDKYDKATKINDQNDAAFYNWGNAISDLAKIKNDEKRFEDSFDKYDKATRINNQYGSAFENWGFAIFELAKMKNDKELFEECIVKFNSAVKLGGSSYNLACVHAFRNNKKDALTFLENSLNNNEITKSFVENDEDWKSFLEDGDFIALLERFK